MKLERSRRELAEIEEEFAEWDDAVASVDPLYAFDLEGVRQLGAMLDGLRCARLEFGFSQRTVAELMSTTQSAVSEIERGLSDPRVSTLRRYAAALGRYLNISATEVPLGQSSIMVVVGERHRHTLQHSPASVQRSFELQRFVLVVDTNPTATVSVLNLAEEAWSGPAFDVPAAIPSPS